MLTHCLPRPFRQKWYCDECHRIITLHDWETFNSYRVCRTCNYNIVVEYFRGKSKGDPLMTYTNYRMHLMDGKWITTGLQVIHEGGRKEQFFRMGMYDYMQYPKGDVSVAGEE